MLSPLTNLLAQHSKDTTSKNLLLKEVKITENGDKNPTAFNFYRSSKLASTEEILSRMPGVNMIRRGMYGMEPGLRNYSAGQINLMIDGMKVYGACTDKMDPVSIYVEPTNLDNIQVSQGAQSNMMGSSIGGSINMALKAPAVNCHTTYITQLSQSFNTVNKGTGTSVSFERASPKTGIRISAVYRNASDYTAGGGKTILYSGFNKINFSAALQQVLNRKNNVLISYLGDLGQNIGYPALPMDVGKAAANIFSVAHVYLHDKSIFNYAETKLYYNQITHSMDDTHRQNVPMHMDMPGWSHTLGAYHQNKLNYKQHALQLRLDAHQNYLRADMTMYPVNNPVMYMQTLPVSHIQNVGLALAYLYQLSLNQNIRFNTRVDYFKQFADKGIGADEQMGMGYDIASSIKNYLKNISLAYDNQLSARLYFQLSLAIGSRLPNSNERYGFYLFNRIDNYDYLGNPNLKPEQSKQLECGLRWKHKKLEVSLNIYYHKTFDYIYSYIISGYSAMTVGAKGVKTYSNIDYAISQGFEGGIKYVISEHWSYIGNAKYTYARSNTGMGLPLVPPFKYQQALRWMFHSFQFQFEYDYAAAQHTINSDFGERATPDFHLMNLRVSKNIKIKKAWLQGGIACENLSDNNYHEHLDVGYIPRPGRNLMLNIGVIFN